MKTGTNHELVSCKLHRMNLCFVPLNVGGNAEGVLRAQWKRVLALTLWDNDSSCANEPFGDVLVVINEQFS